MSTLPDPSAQPTATVSPTLAATPTPAPATVETGQSPTSTPVAPVVPTTTQTPVADLAPPSQSSHTGLAVAVAPAGATEPTLQQVTPAVAKVALPDSSENLGPMLKYSPSCADLAPKQVQIGAADRRTPSAVAYAVFAKTALLWDTSSSTTITYAFLPGTTVGTSVQQAKVNQCIGEWSWYANINFSLVDASSVPAPMIRVTFDAAAGNWSYVGNLALNVPPTAATINLGDVPDGPDASSGDPIERSIIMHEFGHALGLTHEHPRDIPLDGPNIKQFYASSVGWTGDYVQENILNVYDKHTLTNFLKYDETSIMRCFMDDNLNLDQTAVFPNSSLSDRDKALMVVNYPLPQLNSNAPRWTLSHALSVLGVPEYYKHSMLAARPADVRKQYAIWLANEILMIPGYIPPKPQLPDWPAGDEDTPDEIPEWFSKTCSDLATHLRAESEDRTSSMVAFAVMTRSTLLWDNGSTITYSYLGGNSTQQKKVDTVAQEWTKYANVVIKKVASGGQIRITFVKDGSWSYVGRETLNVAVTKATMNFGWVKGDSSVIGSEERGTILHEFGHALGLLHEHQSPARGGTLTLDEEAVYEFYELNQGWSRAMVKEQIIDVYSRDNVSNYSQVDLNSIMMYFMPPEMNTERIDVRPNYVLSDLDKAYIAINYPFQSKDPKWTLAYALEVAGVTGAARENIARESDAAVIRQKFSVWNAASRAETAAKTSAPGTAGRDIQHDLGGGDDGEDEDEDKDDEDDFDDYFDPKVIKEAENDTAPWCSSEDPDVLQEDDNNVETSAVSHDLGPARGVAEAGGALWSPGETIRYWFQQPSYRRDHFITARSKLQRKCLKKAFKQWAAASGLQIVEAARAEEAPVKIWISDSTIDLQNSCSRIGKAAHSTPRRRAYGGGNRETTMYIHFAPGGNLSPGSPDRLKALRSCRHEVGHMLGLRHEHGSPVSRTSTADEPNRERIAIWTDWDPLSIMLYKDRPHLADPSIRTQFNYKISDVDKAFVKSLYAQNEAVLREGIAALGLVGEEVNKVIQALAQGQGSWKKKLPYALFELSRQLKRKYGGTRPRATSSGGEAPQRDIQGDGGKFADGFDVTVDQKIIREITETEPAEWCASEERDMLEGTGDVDNTDFEDSEDNTARGLGPARGVAEGPAVLWKPRKKISYWFQQASYRPPLLTPRRQEQRDLLVHVFGEWEAASGLQIREAANRDVAVIQIWISDSIVGPQNCWSRIGRRAINNPNVGNARGGDIDTTMFIHFRPGSVGPGSAGRAWALKVCRHEVGHMLGLRHEHGSPLSQTVPTPEDNRDRIAVWTDYDPLSIMLYRNLPLAADPQTRTATNYEISAKDRAFVKALYARTPDSLRDGALALGLSAAVAEALRNMVTQPGEWGVLMTAARVELARQLQLRYGGVQPGHAANPGGPANAVEDPDTVDGRELTKGEFLPILIKSLKKFFNPGGNQMFTLQFPGRFLQMSQYAWDTGSAGIYGQFIKPVVVNESEFRLTDQLYDVAEVVSGPNGNSLSQAYTTVLNNLLPIFRNNGLAAQQDQIRQWLLREVKTSTWVREIIDRQHTRDTDDSVDDSEVDAGGTQTNGDGPAFAISNKLSEDGTVNRMELSNALMQEYLMAKQAWEVERDAMIEEALQLKLGTTESSAALNTLTRRLAHTTAAREAQLAAKYSDVVVRGYTHNVREYVGYLDVRTSAEALQDAKDSLREAAMSSLDGSLNVYPVQMTPIDWFESLSTSFTLEDLTQDPDLIYQQIRAKSQQLDVLNSQLTALRFGSKGDPEQLRDAVTQAQENLDNAQANLALKYSSNVISVAKTCYTKDGSLDEGQLGGLVESGDIVGVVLNDLINDMQSTSAAQKALTGASRAFSQALAGYALAQATDTRQQQEQIRLQVEGITSDINELNARYTSLNTSGHRPLPVDPTADSQLSVKDVPSFPTTDDTADGSRWQQFELYHQVESDYSRSSSASSASASAMHVNLWLLSADTSESSSQGRSSSVARTSTDNVTLAFRATLVTADRAGWFQPQFFKQSNTFYHVDPSVTWSKWPAGVKDVTTLKGLPQRSLDPLNSQSLLPAFPIGYIICKDITIKISSAGSSTAASRETMKRDAAASGGVLCFSYSQSSSSSSDDSSYSFQSCADGCVIRIPGPQILGYIMQLTDNDTTKDMPNQLPDNFFIPDADYDAATQGIGGGPASGLNPNGETITPFFKEVDDILKKARVPTSTMNGIHEAIQKELNALSEDVATRVKKG